jgi:CRP-like cAMP-binding protein
MADEEINIRNDRFDHEAFIAEHGGVIVTKYHDRQIVYTQGDPAEGLFYIISGGVKLSVVSEQGKEGIIAMLGKGDFFGEGCLDGHLLRNSTITTTSACEIARFKRSTIDRALMEDVTFSNYFLNFILHRNQKLQADLIDQLFNSSEKRLARILLTLANTKLGNAVNVITIPMTQETLASMVGTTRARINQFMNKFKKLGYIEYNGQIKVHNSLFNIILIDQPLHDNQ